MFEPLTLFEGAPDAGVDTSSFSAHTAPADAWPSRFGCSGQTSRGGSPLLTAAWRVAWQAELGGAEGPDGVLAGAEHVVVSGATQLALFRSDGSRSVAFARRGHGGLLDVAGGRLLASAPEHPALLWQLHSGKRADLPLMLISQMRVHDVIAGPDLLVVVTIKGGITTRRPEVLAQSVRPPADTATDRFGVLAGVRVLGGMVHQGDDHVVSAAGRAGPVLAVPGGIAWYDWQLRPRAERPRSGVPHSLSVAEGDQAVLIEARGSRAHLTLLAPSGDESASVELPWSAEQLPPVPPGVGPRGEIVVRGPDELSCFDAALNPRWTRRLGPRAGFALTSNGFCLTTGAELTAIAPDGEPHLLWRTDDELVANPVLVGSTLYVVTERTLYRLATD